MVLCICGNRLKIYEGMGFKKMRRGIFLGGGGFLIIWNKYTWVIKYWRLYDSFYGLGFDERK